MATPLDFIERVMAWPGPSGPGWVNLHWKVTVTGKDGQPHPVWRGTPYKEPGPLVARAQRLAMDVTKAEDIYFCLSVQAQSGIYTMKDGREITIAKRDGPNATLLKAIWADVDVKAPPKGYTDPKEARRAVLDFCTKAKMPLPSALVNSGGGVHVYWISDKPLTVAEWAPYAAGLRAEAERLGLRCDLGVTVDCARILRMPGTFNRKIKGQDRPVAVTSLGVDYDFAKDLAHIKAIGMNHVTAPVTKAAPFDLSAFAGGMPALLAADPTIRDELDKGQGTFTDLRENLPLKIENVLRECGHFQEAAKSRGAGHGQGLWMQTVLATTWLEDGYRWAKMFSKGHKDYDKTEGELKKMWARKMADRQRGMGWPGCHVFENEGCTACKTCKWRGKIKSPLSLADRVQPPAPPPPAPPVNPLTQAPITAQSLSLPNNYTLINGVVHAIIKDKDDPNAPPTFQQILEGEILSRPRVILGNPSTFFFKYKQGVNYMDVSLPLPALTSEQKLLDALYHAGVHVCIGAEKLARAFMRSFSSKIDMAVKRLSSAPVGWVYDNGVRVGFAFAGTLYKMDGTQEESGIVQNEVTKHSGPCGEVKYVFEALEMLSEERNYGNEVLALQAWASPLLDIAGLRSTAVVWGWSSRGGAHKTGALQTGCALWYAPVTLRERGGATTIGLENKMDTLRNLPCCLDEMNSFDEIERVESVFNRITEGGQGSRGAKDGGNRPAKTWQLVLVCGANQSLYGYYDRKNYQTDAKAQRIFECIIERKPGMRNRTQVDQLIGALDKNYGHLGVLYSQYLVNNYHQLAADYQKLSDQVEAELAYPETGRLGDGERFWKASVVLTLMSARIANEITGKNYFHYDEIKQYLYDMFRRNRQYVAAYVTTAGSASHTGEAWAKLGRLWMNNQLATNRMAATTDGRPKAGVMGVEVYTRPPQDRGLPVMMHWVKEPPMLRIAHIPLIEAVTTLELGTGVVEKFKKEYGGKVVRRTFMAGLPVQDAKSRMQVWEIPITQGHPLYDEWAGMVRATPPATPASAAAQAQDTVTATVTTGDKALDQKIAAAQAVTADALEKLQ